MDLISSCIYGFNILILVNMVCCADPPCPSTIKTCYKCEVIGGCNQTEIYNATEEECLSYLTQQVSLWSVEYNFTSGTCRGSNCEDIQIKYNAGKVIHQKTCETECRTYTLTRFPKTSVTGSVPVPLNITSSLQEWECLSLCLATNASCTVAFESNSNQCSLYTECQDACALMDKQNSWKVYIKSCIESTNSTATLSATTPTTAAAPSTVSLSAASLLTSSTSASPPSTMSTSAASSTSSSLAVSASTTSTSSTASSTNSLSSTNPLVQTTAKQVKKLYIMPCICYKNKTFTNLTQEEIIAHLIEATKIDTTKTALAKSRLISRTDSRASSAAIGTAGLAILCVLGGIMVCCDMITICDKFKSQAEKYKCSGNTSNESLDDEYNLSEEEDDEDDCDDDYAYDYEDDDDDDDDDVPPPPFKRQCWT